MENKKFIEREWNESIEGNLDEDGFFVTPNGSFWDSDNVYFNREGYDKHGGYYDDDFNYIPGEGWDHIKGCYKDEIPKENFHKDDISNKLYEKNKGIEVLDGGEESNNESSDKVNKIELNELFGDDNFENKEK